MAVFDCGLGGISLLHFSLQQFSNHKENGSKGAKCLEKKGRSNEPLHHLQRHDICQKKCVKSTLGLQGLLLMFTLSSLIYSDIYLNTFCFDTNSTRTLCSLNLNNNIILGSLFLSCLLGVGLTVLMIAAVFYLRRHFSLATFYPNHVKLFSKADM